MNVVIFTACSNMQLRKVEIIDECLTTVSHIEGKTKCQNNLFHNCSFLLCLISFSLICFTTHPLNDVRRTSISPSSNWIFIKKLWDTFLFNMRIWIGQCAITLILNVLRQLSVLKRANLISQIYDVFLVSRFFKCGDYWKQNAHAYIITCQCTI